MRRWKAVLGVLGLLAVVGAAVLYFRYRSLSLPPEALDLSRRVTGTDRPLDDEGRLDLTSALPTRGAGAPPPEENAVVALLPLLGTDALLGDREKVLRELQAPSGLPAKVERPPRPGVGHEGWAKLDDEARAGLKRWLAEVGPTLEAFVEATRRPRFWSPRVPGHDAHTFPSSALPCWRLSDLTVALATRAEMRLVEGDGSGGWDDLQALLRLHALTDEPGGFLGGMVRSGFLHLTLVTLLRGLEVHEPAPELQSALTDALARIRPVQTLTPEWEFERVGVVSMFLHGVLGEGLDPTTHDTEFSRANRAVAAIHASFDEVAPWMAATSIENVERLEQHAKASSGRVQELNERSAGFWGKAKLALRTWWHGDAFVGRVAGECLGSLAVVVSPIRMKRTLRDEEMLRMTLLALALRAHEQRHGEFPATLAGLSPTALAPLAANPLGVGPTPYRLDEEGCVLGNEALDEFLLRK